MRFLIPPWFFLLFPFFLLSHCYSHAEISDPDLDPNPVWQVLSKKNFSSEIHLHSHILLLITVPWSGEARSLMKEIKHMVSINRTEYGELKLMVVYRNSEKMIADMFGASEGTHVIYYYNSTPLKYNGRLRALNMLSSVLEAESLRKDEILLKSLSGIKEIEEFVESTEKSVFLIELCNWSTKLMRQNNESYEKVVRDAYSSVESLNIKDKITENEELYGADVSVSPWDQLGLTSASQNTSEETLKHEKGSKCTNEEFEKFQSFYKEFLSIARENFLPLEKQRFGLVTNKSLLNYLGIKNVNHWAVLVQYSFCPNCSVLVRESKEIRQILYGHHPLVKELERNDQNAEVSFPENRPSLVLFTDTSSQNPQIRYESKLALEIIRKYAWQNRNYITPPKISPKIPTNRDSSEQKTMKLNEDLIVINQNINEGNQNKLMDTLAKLIQERRAGKDKSGEKRISVLAEKLGFQLLSEDFSVLNVESNNTSLIGEKDINEGLNTQNHIISEFIEENELNNMNYVNDEADNSLEKDNNEAQIEEIKEEISSDSDDKMKDSFNTEKIASGSVNNFESETELPNNNNEYFTGSIYFSNGDNELLNSLTSNSTFPSLLIINPLTQRHYIYSNKTPITYSSLETFIKNFLNQSLNPYIKSDPLIKTSKEIPKPPFVNLDFREADSIPRVSADQFCELILGFENCLNNFSERNLSLSFGDAWERDVLVLFSNSWCGFCQKMEFVLREVFRAFKHFVKEREIKEQKENFSLNDLPSIYLMDCTRNDCSPFLSSEKMEFYPSLFLFPAKSKAYIPYQGAAYVLNIFEFLHANLNNFKKYKGILWTHAREPKINIPKPIPNEISSTIQAHKNSKTDSKLDNNSNKYKITVGSTLSATDKFSDSSPFYNSTVLIVSTNRQDGFQGLIYNKPMKWNVFKDPNGDIEPIKNIPLFYGGPISPPGFPLVSLSNRIIEGFVEVINGVYFGNGVVTNNAIKRIKNGDELNDGLWFFFGYSGWGFEQLFHELDKGIWDLSESLIASLDWPISSK